MRRSPFGIRRPRSAAVRLGAAAFALALLSLPVGLEAGGLSFFVKFNAGYGGRAQSFDLARTFEQYVETGSFSGRLRIDTQGLVLEPGIGVLFTPNLGLEILYVPVSKAGSGDFSAVVPHPLYFNRPRTTSWSDSALDCQESEIALHLLGRLPLLRGKADVYAAAGVSFFPKVEVTSLEGVSFDESGYPYESVTAVPTYGPYSKSVTGFSLGAGGDFFFTPNLGLNLSARYVLASARLDVGAGQQIEVKPGGLRLSGGLKLSFGL
jgi:hypothetical protein